jgi:hypothetical protein
MWDSWPTSIPAIAAKPSRQVSLGTMRRSAVGNPSTFSPPKLQFFSDGAVKLLPGDTTTRRSRSPGSVRSQSRSQSGGRSKSPKSYLRRTSVKAPLPVEAIRNGRRRERAAKAATGLKVESIGNTRIRDKVLRTNAAAVSRRDRMAMRARLRSAERATGEDAAVWAKVVGASTSDTGASDRPSPRPTVPATDSVATDMAVSVESPLPVLAN